MTQARIRTLGRVCHTVSGSSYMAGWVLHLTDNRALSWVGEDLLVRDFDSAVATLKQMFAFDAALFQDIESRCLGSELRSHQSYPSFDGKTIVHVYVDTSVPLRGVHALRGNKIHHYLNSMSKRH